MFESLGPLILAAVLLISVVPVAVYLSVKLGTFAHLRAKERYRELYPKKKEERNGQKQA